MPGLGHVCALDPNSTWASLSSSLRSLIGFTFISLLHSQPTVHTHLSFVVPLRHLMLLSRLLCFKNNCPAWDRRAVDLTALIPQSPPLSFVFLTTLFTLATLLSRLSECYFSFTSKPTKKIKKYKARILIILLLLRLSRSCGTFQHYLGYC